MLRNIQLQDLRKKFSAMLDERVRAITAGLSLNELRALVRGEPPTEKPNPRYKFHTTSFLAHIRPRYYEKGSTIFTHTFRLGFFTAFFFFVEFITGLILMVYYSPTPTEAYSSILKLMTNVPFGQMLRDIHRLGAEGMVIFAVLHMLRTFLTGSYKKERSFTWLTGVVLLGITLWLSFTGYLLPWDQLAYWAVTIGTSMFEAAPVFGNEANLLMRGAPDIAASGLLRFYLQHIVLFPFAAILVISIHYYKVSREHGISQPAKFIEGEVPPAVSKEAKTRIDFLPDLLTHEVFLTALGLFALVLGVTIFGYHAPLETIANPQVTPLDTKAPWYFWWLQGMLKLGDKTLMGIVIPTILAAILVLLPYIDRNPHRSLFKRPLAISVGLLGVLGIIVLSYMGLPQYGIKTSAATRIVQDLSPQEGSGPVQKIPFEQLQAGIYEVGITPARNLCPNIDFGCPELESVFGTYTQRVDAAVERGDLPAGTGVMVIEDWQQDLKKVTFRIIWQEGNQTKTYERHSFFHRERGSE